MEVHEIERRSQAPARWGHRCNYLLVCQGCHKEYDTLRHPYQLSVKLIADPSYFDLDAWLRLKDPDLKAPDRITPQEVMEAFLKTWKAAEPRAYQVKSMILAMGRLCYRGDEAIEFVEDNFPSLVPIYNSARKLKRNAIAQDRSHPWNQSI